MISPWRLRGESMIRFPCPHCGAKLQVSPARAGKEGRCPHCKNKLTVPPPPEPELELVRDDSSADTRSPSKLLEAVAAAPQPLPTDKDDDAPANSRTKRWLDALGRASIREHADEHRAPWPFDILLYPMNVSGIIHLLIFSFLPPLWAQAATARFWMAPPIGTLCWLIVLTLYLLHYASLCVSDSAQGAVHAADIMTDSSLLSIDGLLSTFATFLPAVVVVWGPPTAYYFLRGQVDWVFVVWVAALGLVSPMVFLSVNYYDSARGVNLILVLPSIMRVPGAYGVLVACLFVLIGTAGLLQYRWGGPHGAWIARPRSG